MARVYSTRFLAGTSFGGEVVQYFVPDGFKAVVRYVTAVSDAPGGQLAEWAIDTADGILFYFALQALPDGTTSQGTDLRVVVNEGESFFGQATGSAIVTLTAHGYLLSLP
jgi:hypothetical protein